MRGDRGTFLIKRLFPGPAVLTVWPWGERTSESGYGLPITRAIVLPVEGTLSVQLVATRGGRVRVAARDADRRLVNAQCMIRNSSGAAQRVAFIGQRGSVMMSTTGYLGSLSPALSDPPLPAGTYTISVDHEGVTREAEIVVKPGETTAVNFVLGR